MSEMIYTSRMTPGGWINARDLGRVPYNDRRVLCLTKTNAGLLNYALGYYSDGRWVTGKKSKVIAWMELPEPPSWAQYTTDTEEEIKR